MATNRKEASPVQAGTLGETSSKNQANHTTKSALHKEFWAAGGNSSEAQRQRLMAHIRQHGSIDTVQARRDLDIMHPGGSVLELRKAGVPIETIRVSVPTEAGKMHSVGRYILAGQDGAVEP